MKKRHLEILGYRVIQVWDTHENQLLKDLGDPYLYMCFLLMLMF